MKVAIVHDDLTQVGGAERVVLALHDIFPDAPVYTSVYDPDGTFPEFRSLDVRTSFLQRVHRPGTDARRLLPLYPLAFERLVLRGFDLVISSSSRFAHGVRAPGALHVCYCYTPARFLYLTERYLAEDSAAPRWARPVLPGVLAALRVWDRRAARRPDVYVGISETVAERIRTIYGRDAVVVHPPVDVEHIMPAEDPGPGEYFLAVARLLPYKRVDLPVRVCTARAWDLVVVGDGPDRARIERAAGPTVRFAGTVGDVELLELYRRCRAVIQAGEEDFGLAPLEANAAGRPAVAYAGGGALETVLDGETGCLFTEGTPDALEVALDRVRSGTWDPAGLRAHAESFAPSRFRARLLEVIDAGMADR